MSYTLRRKCFLIVIINSLLLSACGEIEFTPDITPILPVTSAPKPFGQTPDPLLQTPEVLPEPTAISQPLGLMTSEKALVLCDENEYFGDERVGSCLAPGGESYFVWLSPERVTEVNRNHEFLLAFRFSALNRKEEMTNIEELVRKLPALGILFGELVGVGIVCGGAIVSAMTGAGLVATAPLGGGCLLSLTAFGYSADSIARDAEGIVVSLNSFYQYQNEAAYDFCRMEGKSDAECR